MDIANTAHYPPELEYLRSLTVSLKRAAAQATLHTWGNDTLFFRNLPTFVQARVHPISMNFLIASAADAHTAKSIAFGRTWAPHYVAGLECVMMELASMNAAQVSADRLDRVVSGGWQQQRSRWDWMGWHPAMGSESREPLDGEREDSWVVPAVTGSISSRTRALDLPRNALAASVQGLWVQVNRAAIDVPGRTLETPDGVFAAMFHRVEDAAYSVLAREVMSVAGAAQEAVDRLIRAHDQSNIPVADIIATIANATPWPLESTSDTAASSSSTSKMG